MGERKVLNKYYPVDFDPSKLPRARRPKDELELVRFMLPMTVRCSSCGEYMYAGRKFNVKKETAKGEDYLGMRIFRFYLKCTQCANPFTIKTDPKNANYVCESGATRNFEQWRANAEADEEAKAVKDMDEDLDTMALLENKTMDAREEMEELNRLDRLRKLRARQARLDIDDVLRARRQEDSQALQKKDLEDEEADPEMDEIQKEIDERRNRVIRIQEEAKEEQMTKRPRLEIGGASRSRPPLGFSSGLRIQVVSKPKEEESAGNGFPAGSLAAISSAYTDSDDSDT